MIGVVLDINVVLDVFLSRSPWLTDSEAVVRAGIDGKVKTHISAFSLLTIFYLVCRYADLAAAHVVVKKCLDSFEIVPVDRQTLEHAAGLPASDFEDNLPIACASHARLDAIVTRDPKGFAASPVPVLSPTELLARIS